MALQPGDKGPALQRTGEGAMCAGAAPRTAPAHKKEKAAGGRAPPIVGCFQPGVLPAGDAAPQLPSADEHHPTTAMSAGRRGCVTAARGLHAVRGLRAPLAHRAAHDAREQLLRRQLARHAPGDRLHERVVVCGHSRGGSGGRGARWVTGSTLRVLYSGSARRRRELRQCLGTASAGTLGAGGQRASWVRPPVTWQLHPAAAVCAEGCTQPGQQVHRGLRVTRRQRWLAAMAQAGTRLRS